MFSVLLFVLPAVALAATLDAKIVGGKAVNIADYPWQGSFRRSSGSHNCGCVFVGGNYALSAGHCGGGSSFTLEFGASNRNQGTVYSIRSVTIHPQYDNGPGFTPNDISIVTTSGNIGGNNISPATVNSNAANPGGRADITGWGQTCGSCSIPRELMGTKINVISDSECQSQWGNSFQSSNMICVWDGRSGTVGACNGDSGGPMTKGSTVYGITSWVATGCLSNYPSVYARVGVFHSWICSITGNAAKGC